MIRRNTWIMVLVFAAAMAGTLWWSRIPRPASTEGEATPLPEPLWSVQPTQISSITVEDLVQGKVMSAQRHPDLGWSLVRPRSQPGDSGRIERAVTFLLQPRPQGVFEADDFAVYGLDEPSYLITLGLVGGSLRQVKVGDLAPTGDVYYAAQPGGSSVLLLSALNLGEVLGLAHELPIAAPTATPEASPTAE